MIKARFKLGVFVAALALAGCSQPVLDIDEPSEGQRISAEEALNSTVVAPARDIHKSEMVSAVERILPSIRVASLEVCSELSLPAQRCEQVRIAEVSVSPNIDDPNAFADAQDNVQMTGGIVRISGSDDEVAAVLAHEFAHVMYGHVESKMSNALVGLAIAGGIALAVGSDGSVHDQQRSEDILRLGYGIGSQAYSPEMEIEADRTAIYILRKAGYQTTAMRDSIIRLSRIDLAHKHGSNSQRVGFLQTHPSSDRRIAHIISAIDDAEAGVPLIVADR